MSLLHSPIKGLPISALGVEDSDNSLRANTCIYLSCLCALMFGKREYMPIVWAWVVCVEKTNHIKSTTGMSELLWACSFINELVYTIGVNSIDCVLQGKNGDYINIASVLSKVEKTSKLCDSLEGIQSLDELLADSEISSEEVSILSTISKMVYLGTSISTAGFLLYAEGEGSGEALDKVMQEIHGVAGIDFTLLPYKVADAYASLKNKTDMYSVWSHMSREVCSTKLSKKVAESCAYENPVDRVESRWGNGDISADESALRDKADSISISEALSNVSASLLRDDVPLRLIEGVLLSCTNAISILDFTLEAYSPVTFMSVESFRRFRDFGETKTLRDLDREFGLCESCYFRFSDDPIAERNVTDRRLWGEKGEDITYAVLISDVMKDTIGILSEMYGKVMVEWRRDVLEYSTLTVNDSSSALYSIPATPANCIKALLPLYVGRAQKSGSEDQGCVPYITEAIFGEPFWVNFVELQIHSKLKWADIVKVTTL